MYYILISFTCLCFLIVHWTSLRGLFWILLSDGSLNSITLGSEIGILLVPFGGVMFPWFLVFRFFALISAPLGKWSCLPDFTSSLQQGKIFSSQFRPRPGSRWAGRVFRQCSWVCVLGEAAAHALKSGWTLLAGLCSEVRLLAPHSSRASGRAPWSGGAAACTHG